MTGAFDEEGQALLYLFRVQGIHWNLKALLAPLRLAAVYGYKTGQRSALRRQLRETGPRPGVFSSTRIPATTGVSSCKSPTPSPSDASVAVVMPFYCRSSAQLAALMRTWEALKSQTSVSIDNFFLVDDAGPVPAPELKSGGAVQEACPSCTRSCQTPNLFTGPCLCRSACRCKSFGSLQMLAQQQPGIRVFVPHRQQAMTLSASWMMTAHHRLIGCTRCSMPRSDLLALWGVSPSQHSHIP